MAAQRLTWWHRLNVVAQAAKHQHVCKERKWQSFFAGQGHASHASVGGVDDVEEAEVEATVTTDDTGRGRRAGQGSGDGAEQEREGPKAGGGVRGATDRANNNGNNTTAVSRCGAAEARHQRQQHQSNGTRLAAHGKLQLAAALDLEPASRTEDRTRSGPTHLSTSPKQRPHRHPTRKVPPPLGH